MNLEALGLSVITLCYVLSEEFPVSNLVLYSGYLISYLKKARLLCVEISTSAKLSTTIDDRKMINTLLLGEKSFCMIRI